MLTSEMQVVKHDSKMVSLLIISKIVNKIDDGHPDNKCEQSDEGSGTITPLPSNASLKNINCN